MNTYTHIPSISYIFVGVTAAILSYVTWVEMQEGDEQTIPIEDSNEQISEPLEEPENINLEEEPNKEVTEEPELIGQEEINDANAEDAQPEKNKELVVGGKKKRKATKKKKLRKNKKQTKHTKLKSR